MAARRIRKKNPEASAPKPNDTAVPMKPNNRAKKALATVSRTDEDPEVFDEEPQYRDSDVEGIALSCFPRTFRS